MLLAESGGLSEEGSLVRVVEGVLSLVVAGAPLHSKDEAREDRRCWVVRIVTGP